MPAAIAPVVRLLLQKRGKARLRLVQPVRVEGRKGRALGRRARDAGVHLRQLDFVLPEAAGELGILRMLLEKFAQLRGRSGIG